MITKVNFKEMLRSLGFAEQEKNVFSKTCGDTLDCVLMADFNTKKLTYPDAVKINDRTTCNFEKDENFVVFECVHRLLEKGYRPEHIELEKRWNLGHEAKGGKADICVYDSDGKNMLLIIECKTFGTEYSKEKKNTLLDGGQLFSYWQQERSTKWLSLYASDFRGGSVIYENDIINCSDDNNLIELAKKDESLLLFQKAYSATEKFEVWKETYQRAFYSNLIFGDDTVAYKIGVRPLRKGDLRDFSPDDKIVNRFEEILRHNNVSDKENAFNRLTALFICKLMDDLFDWLQHAEDHLLIRSCVFHYEFEFIHPFADGNGRMGRLWQSLILAKLHPVFQHLPVETMVHDNQQEYYHAINASSSVSNSGIFIDFMLGELLRVLKLHQTVEVGAVNGAVNLLLEFICLHPGCRANTIATELHIPLRSIQRYLTQLKQDGKIEFHGAPKNGGYFVK